jgi:hypothetical protein
MLDKTKIILLSIITKFISCQPKEKILDTDKQLRITFVQKALEKTDKIEQVLPIVAEWMSFINTGHMGFFIPSKPIPASTPSQMAKKAEAKKRVEKPVNSLSEKRKRHKNGGKDYSEDQRKQIAELLNSARGKTLIEKIRRVAPKVGRSVRGIRQQIGKNKIPGYPGYGESSVKSAITSSINNAKRTKKATVISPNLGGYENTETAESDSSYPQLLAPSHP